MSPYIIPGIASPIEVACQMFNVTEEELQSTTRRRDVVIPRQLLMFYYHKIRGYNATKSGKPVKRDHATVWHAVKVYKRDMHQCKEYRYNARKFFKAVI